MKYLIILILLVGYDKQEFKTVLILNDSIKKEDASGQLIILLSHLRDHLKIELIDNYKINDNKIRIYLDDRKPEIRITKSKNWPKEWNIKCIVKRCKKNTYKHHSEDKVVAISFVFEGTAEHPLTQVKQNKLLKYSITETIRVRADGILQPLYEGKGAPEVEN
jgi:hypothetical protein